MVRLPDAERSVRIRLAVSTEYRRMTDGQTDRQTDTLRQHSPRYAYVRFHSVRSRGDRGIVSTMCMHQRVWGGLHGGLCSRDGHGHLLSPTSLATDAAADCSVQSFPIILRQRQPMQT